MKIEQRELWELLPGAAGGQELRRRKGRDYFAQLGARGGTTTRDRYGVDYLKELAQRGGEANRQRYHTLPRTVQPWYGGVERRIPYWPPTMTKRRKRPIYIRVELEGEQECQRANAQEVDNGLPHPDAPDRLAVEHMIYAARAPETHQATD
jgi:hypothetical protein